eukprot:TRINITY_DN10398_c0_g1_i1.p1 TRINITY_DN10398_c0_g1~~TRINITY_DN10398_c0_g1_i1.p1  ORF type:complete len:373 (+),score=27.75 TRINITY_DN10398_c0_g1_i1:214-1332(+)
MSQKPNTQVLYLTFNQDYSCFACGTPQGFRVFSTQPCKELFRRDLQQDEDEGGGILTLEMLFRCNILAFTGQLTNQKYPPNKVMIWDDNIQKCIGELSFRSQVKSIRLRRDQVAIALLKKVLVYNFADLKLIYQIETCENKDGLIAFSAVQNNAVLACLGPHPGEVRVQFHDLRNAQIIKAHNSALAALAISIDGKNIATASEKGTLIRIFEASSGNKLYEFRRGTDQAQIYSIAFSVNAEWIACTSDKGTVHIFALREPSSSSGDQNQSSINQTSSNGELAKTGSFDAQNALSSLRGYLPAYFSSHRSVAQYRLGNHARCFVGFGAEGTYTLSIISVTGECHTVKWDPINGGQCKDIQITQFMQNNTRTDR